MQAYQELLNLYISIKNLKKYKSGKNPKVRKMKEREKENEYKKNEE